MKRFAYSMPAFIIASPAFAHGGDHAHVSSLMEAIEHVTHSPYHLGLAAIALAGALFGLNRLYKSRKAN